MYGWSFHRGWSGLGTLATPPSTVQTALQSASSQYGVPLSLLTAVAQQESSFNPSAVSSKGATGLMQIMPANYASLGITNPTDPQQSANAGAQYLSQLYAQYGNWNDALVAYNEGPGNLANQGVFPDSQAYADAILANSGLSTITPVSADGSTGSLAVDSGDLSSLFDFSAGQSTPAGGINPLLIGGIGLGLIGVLWALS